MRNRVQGLATFTLRQSRLAKKKWPQKGTKYTKEFCDSCAFLWLFPFVAIPLVATRRGLKAALNPLVKVTRIKVTYPRFFSAFWPARAVELNRGRMYEFECENSKSRCHRSRGYVW